MAHKHLIAPYKTQKEGKMINVYVKDLYKDAELFLIMKDECLIYSDGEITCHKVENIEFTQDKETLVKEVKTIFNYINKYDLKACPREVKFMINELETALVVLNKVNNEIEYERFLALVEGDDDVIED